MLVRVVILYLKMGKCSLCVKWKWLGRFLLFNFLILSTSRSWSYKPKTQYVFVAKYSCSNHILLSKSGSTNSHAELCRCFIECAMCILQFYGKCCCCLERLYISFCRWEKYVTSNCVISRNYSILLMYMYVCKVSNLELFTRSHELDNSEFVPCVQFANCFHYCYWFVHNVIIDIRNVYDRWLEFWLHWVVSHPYLVLKPAKIQQLLIYPR